MYLEFSIVFLFVVEMLPPVEVESKVDLSLTSVDVTDDSFNSFLLIAS